MQIDYKRGKKKLVIIIQWFCNIKAYMICHNRLSHITRIKHLLTKYGEKEYDSPLTSILPLNHQFLKVRGVSGSYMIFQFKILPLHLHTKLNCWTLYNYHYPISFVLTQAKTTRDKVEKTIWTITQDVKTRIWACKAMFLLPCSKDIVLLNHSPWFRGKKKLKVKKNFITM